MTQATAKQRLTALLVERRGHNFCDACAARAVGIDPSTAYRAAAKTMQATAQSTQAQLRPAGHVITVTRNWSRILVDGVPVVLDAPARVRRGVWLVPDTFLARVQPRVQPVTTVQPVAAGASATTAPTVRVEAAPV